MPHARITYRWASGDEVDMDVDVEDQFPDSVAEAVSQVLRMYRETVPDGETATPDA